jgi:bifunctional UDP-N-acetylglucosamine pyrophosphorylase/glucosamine-1-phosphate N-acetyltransferase
MSEVHVVILAAGKGTRMKSAHPKVLHPVAGTPMIERVLDAAAALNPRTTVVVLGFCATVLKTALEARNSLEFVVQEPQLGTAHALMTTESLLAGRSGSLGLLSGDVPLLTAATLRRLIGQHTENGAAATVVTAIVPDPKGYGRIIRADGQMERIVEERDATPAERTVREINAGIYAFAIDGLFDALKGIATSNAQREYYLPDLIEIFRRSGRRVDTMTVSDANEIRGVNSRAELAEMNRLVRASKNNELMDAGVTLDDPATIYVDSPVTIGADSRLHPNVSVEGRTAIGGNCDIHSGVRIIDSQIGDRVTILNHCVIRDAVVEDDAQIGPFAHFRAGVSVGQNARVGNFVELKKSRLGSGSKAMHLAYLGDASIGSGVNIGAGTITCNYDGASKHPTIIEDGAFIGSDSQLIAPITVGKDAYVGTGTTVRENVPAGALAVSAGKQRNLEGWVAERKTKKARQKNPA